MDISEKVKVLRVRLDRVLTGSKVWEEERIVALNTLFTELKNCVLEGEFADKEEEMLFFRASKPAFASQLLFALKAQKLHLELPAWSEEFSRRFLELRLKEVNDFFEENKLMCSYYRSEGNHLDELLFLRGRSACPSWLCAPRVDCDERFSTVGDGVFAELMASEMFAGYINGLLNGKDQVAVEAVEERKFSWTGEQVNLVELIYGLYYTGQVNNGNAEVKDIQEVMERAFGVKIKAGYHVFGNIRRRKSISPTAFLDKMRESILNRVDEDLAFHPQRDKLRRG